MVNQTDQRVVITDQPYNAETPLSALLEDLTPLELVYVRNHFEAPDLDAANWLLSVDGAVKKPVSIPYSELKELPPHTLTVTLECAGNGRRRMDPQPKGTPWEYGAVSVVRFKGTALTSVLDLAGFAPDTVEVVFHGADRGQVAPGRNEHFVRSLPLETALHPDTILAWEMNGQRLTAQHGFPLRLVVPGWYGMASVKWLRRITLVNEPHKSFFQSEHYVYLDEEGTAEGDPVRQVRPRSLILSPSDGSILGSGEIEVRGIAWSGYGVIAEVELSTDGGSHWLKTIIEAPSSRYSPQAWRLLWTPEIPGRHQLLCRATDSEGNSQPAAQRWNRLGYGNNGPHVITVIVQ